MDTAPANVTLAAEHAAACPHCGTGGGSVADSMPAICTMLTELAGYSLRWMRVATEQMEAAGVSPGHEQAVVMEIVSRSTRRTLALAAKIVTDSQKTPEERAAERAERAARAERARLREKITKVTQGAAAVVRREAGASEREYLLSDMRERLLYPDVDTALLREDVGPIVMRVLKDVGIAPKGETWSDALMAHEISATHAEMKQIEAGRTAPAPDVDWREGVEFSKPPDGVTKIGRFTFGPGGVLLHQDPPERPESEWPPDILERPLPDLLRGRKPPGTG
jgi:hypothetical protein